MCSHINPIFSVLLASSVKINSWLFLTHPVCLISAVADSSKQGAKGVSGEHVASVEPETPKGGVGGAKGTEDRDAEGVEGVGNGEEVSPPQPTGGSGWTSWASPAGSGAELRRKTSLLLSKRVRTPLVATFVEN